MRILIAEDDQVLADGLLLVFRRCAVPSAFDLREACVPTHDFQCPCQCRTAEPGMCADPSGRICNKGSSCAVRKRRNAIEGATAARPSRSCKIFRTLKSC